MESYGEAAEARRHTHEQYARVEHLLRQQLSPEQVANLLKKEGEFVISFQTIYRHVRRDWKAKGTLYQDLRHRYKRRKRHYGLERRGRLQGKRMIDERPAHIELRREPGHWDGDTVMGNAMGMTHHYNDYSSAADCRTWWLNSPAPA